MHNGLKFYNTLHRRKEDFVPIENGFVKLYACGPTVYNYAHIGNLRTYIFNDILRRTILMNGLRLMHVMNITDVGHLTDDADEGEDKMLVGAKREKKSVWEIAKYYEKAFFNDTDRLNIQRPDIICRATDHIKDMIEMNKRIEKNGFTYLKGGNLYFDTMKTGDYGKLARLRKDDLLHGARTDVDPNKKNMTDFVLWFTKSKFENQEMKWESPWGTGYPGWHIECCAMSSKYLGDQFDIHTGGIDHIPIHHTNEIAEAEAATGKKPWVKYWLHGEFLVMDKGKMSKSSGGFLTLNTLSERGFDPMSYRFLCLSAHYRKQLMFSWEAMKSASNGYKALRKRVSELDLEKKSKKNSELIEKYKLEFKKFINDDLNIPRSLALLNDLLKDSSVGDNDKYNLVLEFDSVFGLKLTERVKQEIPAEINELIKERENARLEKNYKLSDEIRERILLLGYSVKDTPDGPELEKI